MAFSAEDLEIAQGYLAEMRRTGADEERLAELVASLRAPAATPKPKRAAKKKAIAAADTLPPDAPEGHGV